jgi:hypothetical protein
MTTQQRRPRSGLSGKVVWTNEAILYERNNITLRNSTTMSKFDRVLANEKRMNNKSIRGFTPMEYSCRKCQRHQLKLKFQKSTRCQVKKADDVP